MSNSNKPKTKSRLSVQEFQTWLQGIMEFQSPDWSPNAEQWAAIFDKIMNLKVEDSVSTSNISSLSLRKIEDLLNETLEGKLKNFKGAPVPEWTQEQYENNPPPTRKSPGLFDEVGNGSPNPTEHQTGPQPGAELISAEELPQLTPEQIQAKIDEAKQGSAGVSSSKPQHRTPNIDTSKGYNSNFV